MIHSQINICHEIEKIPKKYEVLLEVESYKAMNKNKEIVATLNVYFKPLKRIFNRYGIRKDGSEPMEMAAEKSGNNIERHNFFYIGRKHPISHLFFKIYTV